jgi:hypothetical protein
MTIADRLGSRPDTAMTCALADVHAIRPTPARRRNTLPFLQALSVLEEMTAGERPVADHDTLTTLVDGLENTARRGGAAVGAHGGRRDARRAPRCAAGLTGRARGEDGREPERRHCAPKVPVRAQGKGALEAHRAGSGGPCPSRAGCTGS